MAHDLVLRPATETDLPAVQALLVETWHATYDPIFGAEQVTATSVRWHALEVLRAQMATAGSAFLVACEGPDIVGTASARQTAPGEITVGRLYVRPRAQRRGIGQALLARTLASFSQAKRARLDVEPRNAQAIAFYVARGFQQVAIENRDHGGSVETVAVFEKIITHD